MSEEVKELMSIISEGQDSEQRRKIENLIEYQLQLIESQDKEIEKLKKEKEYWVDEYEVLNELRISLLEYLNCDKNDYHGDLTIKTHNIDTEFLRGYSKCADDYYDYISEWKITNDGKELIEREVKE